MVQSCTRRELKYGTIKWLVNEFSVLIASLNAYVDLSIGARGLHTGKCIRRFAGIYAYCRYSLYIKS